MWELYVVCSSLLTPAQALPQLVGAASACGMVRMAFVVKLKVQAMWMTSVNSGQETPQGVEAILSAFGMPVTLSVLQKQKQVCFQLLQCIHQSQREPVHQAPSELARQVLEMSKVVVMNMVQGKITRCVVRLLKMAKT